MLTPKQVRCIRDLRQEGYSQKETAKKCKCSVSSVQSLERKDRKNKLQAAMKKDDVSKSLEKLGKPLSLVAEFSFFKQKNIVEKKIKDINANCDVEFFDYPPDDNLDALKKNLGFLSKKLGNTTCEEDLTQIDVLVNDQNKVLKDLFTKDQNRTLAVNERRRKIQEERQAREEAERIRQAEEEKRRIEEQKRREKQKEREKREFMETWLINRLMKKNRWTKNRAGKWVKIMRHRYTLQQLYNEEKEIETAAPYMTENDYRRIKGMLPYAHISTIIDFYHAELRIIQTGFGNRLQEFEATHTNYMNQWISLNATFFLEDHFYGWIHHTGYHLVKNVETIASTLDSIKTVASSIN